ncbi:hypothetical protein [Luteibacter sp. CQ10]|uniref:hypothetical protein n=1 Tax=Luteibacter sp. CQ10 TaxID=2805821 RepID=UPI0034A4B01B
MTFFRRVTSLIVLSCVVPVVDASEGMELTISHDGRSISEPNTVVVTLSNKSGREVFAYRDHSAFSKPQGRLTGAWFKITDSFNRPVVYKGRSVFFGAPSASAFIRLEPGETVSVSVDLSREYELPIAGKVAVATSVAVYDRVPEIMPNGESEDLPYESVKSNVESFYVAKPA